MRRALTKLIFSILLFSAGLSQTAIAQCPGGYTQAQMNWDNLDYYYNSGVNIAPYGTGSGNYVSNAMEQTQRFAIGTRHIRFVTSAAGMVNGENAVHTGNLTVAGIPYTGDDAQIYSSANGQTVTLTFSAEVRNTSFTLYDIDATARIDIDAFNSLNAAQNVNVVFQGGTILAVTNNNNVNTYVNTASATNLANSSNQGSATFTIANPINRIVITFTTRGTDPVIWLSDITSCVTGSFPNNYHQTGQNQPFTGPTQNMASYFLVTPDNNSAYYLDPVTAEARWLFTDAERDYINSFAYDPYNRHLYYITEDVSLNPNNKQLKRYDYNTETFSVLVPDLSAALGIPTFNAGVESAGCAFYDGALYFGIEGGKYDQSGTSNDRTRETIIYRIELDGSLNPTVAYQVFATNAYVDASNTSLHDWGDFVIRDGDIYNFNTARTGSNYSQSKFHHYDLMTGTVTNVYNNPGTSVWNGQAGMIWDGSLFYFREINSTSSGVGTYDEAGNCGAIATITVVGGGPAWPRGAGDASDPFRPKCDFGDAPASYDPNPVSPAVHEFSENITIGTAWDREWINTGDVNASVDGGDEDGIAYTPILGPGAITSYYTDVTVFNNSGADATLIAWLDYNGNGVFDASEAITPIIVPSSGVTQNYTLYWPSFSCTLPVGSFTYLRVRMTNASAGMTTSHATGYFTNGEVEDYRVLIDNYPLTVKLLSFDASAVNNEEVRLNWQASEEIGFAGYGVERSADGVAWSPVTNMSGSRFAGVYNYNFNDLTPLKGTSYYRLKLKDANGGFKYSDVRKVHIRSSGFTVAVMPNPASTDASVKLKMDKSAEATITILSDNGKLVYINKVFVPVGESYYRLPLHDAMPAGTYIVRITANGLVVNRKLIVYK